MSQPAYFATALAIVFVITVALRAVPFAVLRPLRESEFVGSLASWMPAGILAILTASTLRTSLEGGDRVAEASLAVAVTVVTHLALGRRTLLSVGLGTMSFVVLANIP
ncbi:AzlD domain-containing protein [Agromyces sp. SYSU K20354]|uniref:branched-chain amino acid transporter permease n=1 Tax=Agromyces cavernae TaxID=2898659 RepID=UPI001E5C60BB|nr:AzlD domain-containing protein [Agromyces cavernae]MCD2443157.1 AzlD domain-containing protein [Agromyces cavernae]